MKKILSLLLALIMCLTVLTSCDVQGLLDQFKDIIHTHPTLTEVLQSAAHS